MVRRADNVDLVVLVLQGPLVYVDDVVSVVDPKSKIQGCSYCS